MDAVRPRRRSAPTTGVPISWATAVDRFARGVHRYHDRVEVLPDRALREQLREPGAVLERALATARAARGRDGNGTGDSAQAVRDVLRAGTLCSHAVEAVVAATTARRARDDEEAQQAVAAAKALAAVIADLVDGCVPASRSSRRLFAS